VIENLQKNMTLKILNFNLTRGYIYKVMKKKLVMMILVEDFKLLQITPQKITSLVHLTI
jgi:hypothetical protein